MYVRIDEKGIVSEIIHDIDPAFPNIPIGERYPVEFIAGLHHCADETNVEYGMQYNEETDSFDYPSSSVINFGGEIIEETGDTRDNDNKED